LIKLLYYVITALAGWLLVSPFVIGYGDAVSIAVAVVAAAAAAVTALLAARKDARGAAKIILGLGSLLAAWGLVAIFLPMGAGVSELLVGLLWAGIGFVILNIQPAVEVIAFDVYGNPMAQIKKISMKDGNLVAKAILLGSMPSTMYLRPEEVWRLLGMMSFETIKAFPRFLVAGAKRANAEAAGAKREQETTVATGQ
jgi:hypothetical protein